MSNSRKTFTPLENTILVTQIGGCCPKCLYPITYSKDNKQYKGYELAHIYPLNATDEEKKILAGVEILGGGNLNHLNNMIPLCPDCHTKFDKPRTKEEYLLILNVKKKAILDDSKNETISRLEISNEIKKIISVIYQESTNEDALLNFNPVEIRNKLKPEISLPTQKKIKNNIKDYYPLVKQCLKDQTLLHLGSANIIACQVKLAYESFKQIQDDQTFIYNSLVEWFHKRTLSQSIDAPEILTSFFIQNCEIFDDNT